MIKSVNLYREDVLTHIGVAKCERWEQLDVGGTDSWMLHLQDGTVCLVDVVPWMDGVIVDTFDHVEL